MISTGKPLFLNTTTGSIEQYTSDVNMDLSGVTLTTLNVSGISTIGGATVSSGAISASSFSGSSLNVSGVSTVGGSTLNSGAISGSTLNVSGISTISGATVSSGVISGISSVTDSSGGYVSLPPGTVISVASSIAPAGFLKANGAAVSRTTYSLLFAGIGTAFGNGNGSTTFNVPDLRGEFIRGWVDNGSTDSGRKFGSTQTDAFQNITGEIFGTYAAIVRYGASGAFVNSVQATGSNISSPQYDTAANADKLDFNASNSPGARTSTETRPRNVALLYCIKF